MISLLRLALTMAGLLGRISARPKLSGLRMLVLAPGSLRETRRKGVEKQLADFVCGEYFEKVVFFHFHFADPSSDRISERVEVIEAAPLPFLGPLNLLRYLWLAICLIRQERITLIRSTDPYYRGLLGALLARLLNLPFCISIHADYDKRYELDGVRGAPELLGSRTRAKYLECLVLAEAMLVLPIRESLIPFLVANGVPTARIRVIPHGLDLSRHLEGWPDEPVICKMFNIPADQSIISFVGRLSRENYVYDVITVARQMIEDGHKDICFLLVGDGPERAGLEQEIRRLGLEDTVRLLGFQPSEIACALRRQSYINLALMGGFSLIEACAAGRPVISYNIEWHYELVKDQKTGFLVQEGSVEAVTAAVIQLLKDCQQAAELGANARIHAAKRHTLQVASAAKIAAYEELYRLINHQL